MRKMANTLLRDIMLVRKGRESREFETILIAGDIANIREILLVARTNQTTILIFL